ncbi:hypothetical protein N9D82_02265 [Gammaproteobacteria bacterium]|nr:hypothetical protein [Gammaproteobacteria bacterium]
MRYFYISDNKNKDATVISVALKSNSNPELVYKEKKINNVLVLESTEDKTYCSLKKEYGENLVDAIIEDDVDIDFIKTGLLISETRKTYLSHEGSFMNQAPTIMEVIINAMGKETNREEPKNIEPNIRDDTPPIKWTGKFFTKKDAITKFVFKKTIQLQHTNGLTYDFLYSMAKDLQDKGQLMFMGGGVKGNEPLIFQLNGTPMRGFLEGRIDGSKYQLLLHLSNMEIKLP